MHQKILKTLIFSAAIALIAATLIGYCSFNYFYLYAHIGSFSDFIFCLLQWVKLAGLTVVAASVFMRSKKFSIVLKYIYCVAPLLSLFWAEKYFGLVKIPQSETEHIYYRINSFMPAALINTAFIAEALLMSAVAVLTAVRDGFKPKTEYKLLIYFIPVFFLSVPLNIFTNIVRLFPAGVYNFFLFKNFSLWHFMAFILLFGLTAAVYKFLKPKGGAERYRYLSLLSIILIVQYMSRSSMLMGDGYNIYKTIYAFIPLFVCNIGVFTASLAIFTKNKRLSDISFFVHAPGALSVFVYFGKASMSNFGTVFDYTFLYFVFCHLALFIICVVPILLKEQSFRIRNCAVPLVYYAVFILSASVASQLISAVSFTYGATILNIESNFSFTQVSPIENNLPQILINIFGLKFDILYLSVLFSAYLAIFFSFCGLYKIIIEKKLFTATEKEHLAPAAALEIAAAADDNENTAGDNNDSASDS